MLDSLLKGVWMSELRIFLFHWGEGYVWCHVAENRVVLARVHPKVVGFGKDPLRVKDLEHVSQEKEHSSFSYPISRGTELKAQLILCQISPGVFITQFIHSPKISNEKNLRIVSKLSDLPMS